MKEVINVKMLQEIFDQKELFEDLHGYLETKKSVLKQTMNQCNNIYLFGTGASLNACYASVFSFVENLKKKPIIIPAAEVGYYVDLISDKDVVIVVSQSGDSFETNVICELFYDRSIDFIGITNNNQSTLAAKATEVLLLCAHEEISSATKTYTATIYVLFYLSVVNQSNQKLMEIHKTVSKILDATYNTNTIVEEISKRDRMYVLSDPLNYSTARATALLFKEKDLILAEAMTLSEFRHGAVEVVKEGFLCFIIVSDLNYKQDFLKHLHFLQSIKATVVVVSSYDVDDVNDNYLIKVPQLQCDVFYPLTMIVSSQLLSVEIANKLNLDVDKFIYLNKVVKDY